MLDDDDEDDEEEEDEYGGPEDVVYIDEDGMNFRDCIICNRVSILKVNRIKYYYLSIPSTNFF